MSFLYRRNMAGGNYPPEKRVMTIAVSQTLKRGDVVILASGAITKAGDAAARIVGVMDEDIKTDSSNKGLASVQIATPTQIWRGTASASASALVLDGTRSYDLNASQQVNVADTTGGSLQILGTVDSNLDVEVQFTSCVFA